MLALQSLIKKTQSMGHLLREVCTINAFLPDADDEVFGECRLNLLPEDILIDIAKWLVDSRDKIAVCLVVDARVRQIFARTIVLANELLEVDLTQSGVLCRQIKRYELCSKMEMLANLMADDTRVMKLKILFDSDRFSFDYFLDAGALEIKHGFRNLTSLTLVNKSKSCRMTSGSDLKPLPANFPLQPKLAYICFENIRLDRTLGVMLHWVGWTLKTLSLKNCPVDRLVLQQIPHGVRKLEIITPTSCNAADLAFWIDNAEFIRHFQLVGTNIFIESVVSRISKQTFTMRIKIQIDPEVECIDAASVFTLSIERYTVCEVCDRHSPPTSSLSALQIYQIERANGLYALLFAVNGPIDINLDIARDIYNGLLDGRTTPASVLDRIKDFFGTVAAVSAFMFTAGVMVALMPLRWRGMGAINPMRFF